MGKIQNAGELPKVSYLHASLDKSRPEKLLHTKKGGNRGQQMVALVE